jgi:hypothetical protein
VDRYRNNSIETGSRVCIDGKNFNEIQTCAIFILADMNGQLKASRSMQSNPKKKLRSVWSHLTPLVLGRAGEYMNHSDAFDFVLLLDGRHPICRGSLRPFLQQVLALRRGFSLLRCGPSTSCLVLHRRDILFWRDALTRAWAERQGFSDVFLHSANGLNSASRKQVGDAGIYVAHSTIIGRIIPNAESHEMTENQLSGPRCGDSLTVNVSTPGSAGDDDREEVYREETGCIPVVDALSPCHDRRKSVGVLLQPRWLEVESGGGRVAIPVQVVANDRPAALFLTVARLVEQMRPECVTIHLDGGCELARTTGQRAALRVAQWFADVHGVRYRLNPDHLDPRIARRLGFRRNYALEAPDGSRALSPTDRLMHMTWNALAHAFEGAGPAGCASNTTVVLEDDLLPAPDLMAYFQHGAEVMARDPVVQVVSAWNDNSFNIREGLGCAVQRGEYFMSLGWLTSRAVYERVVSHVRWWRRAQLARGWPSKKSIGVDEVLSVRYGWESPFLFLFMNEEVHGLFPSMSRVSHQRSDRGWSTTPIVQSQVIRPRAVDASLSKSLRKSK